MPKFNFPTSFKRHLTQRDDVQAWIKSGTADLDMVFCLRWSLQCAAQRRLHDEIQCNNDLRKFFARLERLLFAKDWKRKKLRRLVTLERTDGTNWHVHGMIECPGMFTASEFAEVLDYVWREHIKIEKSNAHTHRHLVWVEEKNTDNYGNYSIKNIGKHGTSIMARIGTLDLTNTYFG